MIKNIEAAKQLIDKYQDFIDNQRLNYIHISIPYFRTLQEYTGFGSTNKCTLCVAVDMDRRKTLQEGCKECVWSSVANISEGACGNDNYREIGNMWNKESNPEDFYELLKERIELLKEAIETSEELNSEELNKEESNE